MSFRCTCKILVWLVAAGVCCCLPVAADDEQRHKIQITRLGWDASYSAATFNIGFHVNPGDRITVYRRSGLVSELTVAEVRAADRPRDSGEVSGTYVSEITSDAIRVFRKPAHQSLKVRFEQDGSVVTGISEEVGLEISGTRYGDRIRFFLPPSEISLAEIKGEWQVSDDGSRLTGKWSYPAGSGKWNLTRVSTPQDIAVEPGFIRGRLAEGQKEIEIALDDIDRIEVQPRGAGAKPPDSAQPAAAVAMEDVAAPGTGAECEISAEARDAIARAEAVWNQGEYTPGAYNLVVQARMAAKPPACDSEQARLLADKAVALVRAASGNLAEKVEPGGYDTSVASEPAERQQAPPEVETGDDSEASVPQPTQARPQETVRKCQDALGDMGKIGKSGDIFTAITVAPTTAVTSVACLLSTSVQVITGSFDSAALEARRRLFVMRTQDKLAHDMARGSGEYLHAMSFLHGCPDSLREVYAGRVQRDFARIFTAPEVDPRIVLANLETALAKESQLLAECKWLS